MPAYSFEILWDGGEQVRWTYLQTDDGARTFARILVQNFKSSDQYHGSARMTVKNQEGGPIASISF